MKRTIILLFCLFMAAAAASPILALDKVPKEGGYAVSTPKGDQALGGKSARASRGLQVAASRGSAVRSRSK